MADDLTELALLQAVVQEPDDVAPRFVLADWYEEQGDVRCEFIRIQLALAEHDADERQQPARAREATLLRENVRRWNAPLHRLLARSGLPNAVGSRKKPIRGWKYARGFVEELTVDINTFVKHADTLSRIGPLRKLTLRNFDWRNVEPVRRLAALPCLARIDSIVVHEWQFHPSHLVALASSKHLQPNAEIVLRGVPTTPNQVWKDVAVFPQLYGLGHSPSSSSGQTVTSPPSPVPRTPAPPVTLERLPPNAISDDGHGCLVAFVLLGAAIIMALTIVMSAL